MVVENTSQKPSVSPLRLLSSIQKLSVLNPYPSGGFCGVPGLHKSESSNAIVMKLGG